MLFVLLVISLPLFAGERRCEAVICQKQGTGNRYSVRYCNDSKIRCSKRKEDGQHARMVGEDSRDMSVETIGNELLPCPFCGAEVFCGGDEKRGYYILCSWCDVQMGMGTRQDGEPQHYYKTKEKALEKWNTPLLKKLFDNLPPEPDSGESK